MKQTWFRKTGWLYMPVHSMGMIITLAAISFIVPVCMSVFRNGDSISDNLFEIFVYASCTIFWWKWIAEKTSE